MYTIVYRYKSEIIFMSSFDRIYEIKREYSKEDFLRNVLINLSKDTNSPSNIMDSKFSEVKEFKKEMINVTADVDVSYSGSVGYDRKETYTDYESKYDKDLGKNIQVPVTKTRIVTDWRPHSGNISTHNKVYSTVNSEYWDYEIESLFNSATKELKNENIIESSDVNLNKIALERAVRGCETHAEYDVRWPGDHQKDTSYHHNTSVTKIVCYVFPYYEVEYTYDGKTYKSRGVAFGKPNEKHKTPQNSVNVESIATVEKRGQSKVQKARKPLKFRTISIVIAVISALLTVGFISLLPTQPTVGNIVGFIISLILLIASIPTAIFLKKKVNKDVWAEESLIIKEKQELNNLKVEKLAAKLKMLGLRELSSNEKNSISEEDDYE